MGLSTSNVSPNRKPDHGPNSNSNPNANQNPDPNSRFLDGSTPL